MYLQDLRDVPYEETNNTFRADPVLYNVKQHTILLRPLFDVECRMDISSSKKNSILRLLDLLMG